jgi:dolichol-phosphate mannosyltransferase
VSYQARFTNDDLPIATPTRNDELYRESNTVEEYSTNDIQCISIIIPTLNEADNIAELITRLDQLLTQEAITYEVIIVDDHSTDNTVAIAEAVIKDHALPARVLMKQGSPGKSFSLMEGFAAARFDILAMIDGDLQYSPESLLEVIHHVVYTDIVVGDRRRSARNSGLLRGILSQVFVRIISLLFGTNSDIQSGLKVFRRHIYEEISSHTGKWGLDLHLVVHAVHKGYLVTNVSVPVQARQGGSSKVRTITVGVELLLEVLRLKFLFLQIYIAHKRRSRLLP